MTKRMIIMVIALVVVFGGVFGYKAVGNYFMAKYFATFQPPPSSVEVKPVQAVQWQPRLAAPASLSALEGVIVSNEVEGVVKSIDFKPGAKVEKGQLLVQLDDEQDVANLKGLKAKLVLAKLNFDRESRLLKTQAVSQTNYDTAKANYQAAAAEVDAQQAYIAKKAIRAPFAGVVGIRRVDPGEYLKAGTEIVSLQSLDKLHADFTLPERDLPKVKIGQSVELHVDTYPDHVFKGEVTGMDPRVEPATRNFKVQVTLDNSEGLLRPGMFAMADVLLPIQENVLTVPVTAVAYNPYGDAVFLVEEGKDKQGKPQLTVKRQYVKTGETQGDHVVITTGLQAGQRIVTVGQLKLRNGSRIVITNEGSNAGKNSAKDSD
ncbi:MAG: efflux RND transporter periplasmic adaptor subunit [Gammaproteobacteria bacterium]|jgi:membrane fusion protein (multidrug efflux system)